MNPEVRKWIDRAQKEDAEGKKIFFSYLCCNQGHYTPKGVNCPTHGRKKFNIRDMLKAHGLEETESVFRWGTGRGNES